MVYVDLIFKFNKLFRVFNSKHTTAGEIVGELYNEILAQYDNPESESTLKSLNMLCVRLVF